MNRIQTAMNNLKAVDSEYYINTLKQRLVVGGAGSRFSPEIQNIDQLEQLLIESKWEEYSHEAIAEGCVAFKTDIAGTLGMINLNTLAPGMLVTLDDRKNTGNVSATVSGILGEEVDFVVMILGQENDQEVMFTVHPGAPIVPSKVSSQIHHHGEQITVAEALAIGLTTAKIA